MHGSAGGTHRMAFGFKTAGKVYRTIIIRRIPSLNKIPSAMTVFGEAKRFNAEDLVDGKTIMNFSEVDVFYGDSGLIKRFIYRQFTRS